MRFVANILRAYGVRGAPEGGLCGSRDPRTASLDEARAGMIIGMTAKSKIAVSLPTELVEQARRAVAAGTATSVSAYVGDALEEKGKLDDLAALLEEMLAATGGPLTDGEAVEADRLLGR